MTMSKSMEDGKCLVPGSSVCEDMKCMSRRGMSHDSVMRLSSSSLMLVTARVGRLWVGVERRRESGRRMVRMSILECVDLEEM